MLIDTLNILQNMWRKVPGIKFAPDVREYPATLARVKLPMPLTYTEGGKFIARGDTKESVDRYVGRFFIEPAAEATYGYSQEEVMRLLENVRLVCLDSGLYLIEERFMVETQPFTVELNPNTFTNTGYTLLEYPLGSELWYRGFEVRFEAIQDWGGE